MRAGVGAGSKFGQRARVHRSRQVFSRSRRGDRGPYPRGAPPLSSRYLRLPVDDVCRRRQVAARRRRGSGRLAAPEHRGQPKLSPRAFPSRRRPGAARVSWTRRGPPRRRDLRSIQASPSAASAPAHRATIRLTSPDASASMRACAWPGCRRGDVRMGQKRRFDRLPPLPVYVDLRTSSDQPGGSGSCQKHFRFLLPALELALLIPLAVAAPHRQAVESGRRRRRPR